MHNKKRTDEVHVVLTNNEKRGLCPLNKKIFI
jgi:hypothetical protein